MESQHEETVTVGHLAFGLGRRVVSKAANNKLLGSQGYSHNWWSHLLHTVSISRMEGCSACITKVLTQVHPCNVGELGLCPQQSPACSLKP
jgi:hypothetical protein